MDALSGTPYLASPDVEQRVLAAIGELETRVALLRSKGNLRQETIEKYYQHSRLEDVTQSNAIEGSPLTIRETELAVQRVTLTGHDPAYAKDAQTLFAAFEKLAQLARDRAATDITQVQTLHGLILGERPGAGIFRSQKVIIRGATHRPPPDWKAVMDAMEAWESWSLARADLPPFLRGAVLHAWLAHIHPFVDGNGRTARAITTLEFVRGGYPPLIIRRKDRARYYEALAASDEGDLAPFLELILARGADALRDLERTAVAAEGYSVAVAALRQKQAGKLAVWNKAAELLVASLASAATGMAAQGVRIEVRPYDLALELDEYLQLCEGQAITDAWAFLLVAQAAGCTPVERLAWIGFRSDEMLWGLGKSEVRGPTLFWSVATESYPKWRRANTSEGPGGEEITYANDGWTVRSGQRLSTYGTEALVERIVNDLVEMLH